MIWGASSVPDMFARGVQVKCTNCGALPGKSDLDAISHVERFGENYSKYDEHATSNWWITAGPGYMLCQGCSKGFWKEMGTNDN